MNNKLRVGLTIIFFLALIAAVNLGLNALKRTLTAQDKPQAPKKASVESVQASKPANPPEPIR